MFIFATENNKKTLNMIFIFCLIPILVVLLTVAFASKHYSVLEYIGYLVIVYLAIAISYFTCINIATLDTEYLGYYITKITYYEPWNEYIVRTCTRQVPCGVDANGNIRYATQTYDCSYVSNHSEYWTYTLNNGDTEYFYNSDEFEKVKARFATKGVFVDMHRHYHTKDGDSWVYNWDKTLPHCYTYTKKSKYKNKIKASKNIFNLEKISDVEATKLGLYAYPEIYDYEQNCIIGDKGHFVDKATEHYARFLNAMYGSTFQFRMYILLYSGKDISIVEKQKAYWEGGNKNEFVICIDYDKTSGKINWCQCFSWQLEPKLEAATVDWFLKNEKLELTKYFTWLRPNIVKENWHRRDFSEFDYINVELSPLQNIIILLVITVVSIISMMLFAGNEYESEYFTSNLLTFNDKKNESEVYYKDY